MPRYSSGMRNDLYLRIVLTVIAGALVYLCLLFTPLPVVSAQAGRVVGARTPGEYTGPAEVVIVDWRLPDNASLPVTITRGEVRVANEVAVTGEVRVKQLPEDYLRTVLVGHEERASRSATGSFRSFDPRSGSGLPVSTVPAHP